MDITIVFDSFLNSICVVIFVYLAIVLCVLAKFEFSCLNYERDRKEEKKYRQYLEKCGFSPYTDSPVSQDFEEMKDQHEKKMESYKKEIELCCEFINRNAKNIYAIKRRAFLYNLREEYSYAIEDYKFLMEHKPKNFYYVECCAYVYAQLKQTRISISLIDEFYKDKEKDVAYYAALGIVFSHAREYQLAIKNYTEAIKLDPNDEILYLQRGSAFLNSNDIENYKKDRKKFDELTLSVSKKDKTDKLTTEDNKSDDKIGIVLKIAVVFVFVLTFFVNYYLKTH